MRKRIIGIATSLLVLILVMSPVTALRAEVESAYILDEYGNDITGKTITLGVGENVRLEVDGYYYLYDDNGNVAYNSAFLETDKYKEDQEWYDQFCYYTIIEDDVSNNYSSNPKVATIDEDGYVHALSVGQTTITMEEYDLVRDETGATVKACGKASCTVVVKEANYHDPFENIDPAQVENPFSDISPSDWYYDYVMYLYAAGMYNGVDFGDGKAFSYSGLSMTDAAPSYQLSLLSNTSVSSAGTQISRLANGGMTFRPGGYENRANTVTVLYNGHKSSGGTIGSFTNNIFTDVSSEKSYYQPVLWASATGTVNGYGDGLFGPLDGITREQFCAILVRYAYRYGFELPSDVAAKTFTDSGSISSWAKDAVSACQKAGIIEGMPDGSFCPKAGITRAQVSAMIYRFYANCVG